MADALLQLWDVAQRLHADAGSLGSASGVSLPPLILMTDAERVPDPLPAATRLPRGSAVLLRHYNWPERRALAMALAEACRRRGLLLLVGADAALAEEIGANGLHLPERLLRPERSPGARSLAFSVITTSAHSRESIARARDAGVDAVLVSPVFRTVSHPTAAPLGLRAFRLLARDAGIPVYALGGINAGNVRRLIGTGATGIAALGALTP